MLTSGLGTRRSSLIDWKTFFWLGLIAVEALVVSYLFDFNPGGYPYLNPVFYATRSVRWAAVALPAFLILIWSERRAFALEWTELTRNHAMAWPLAINAALFMALCAACAAFSAYAATAATPPWHLLPFLGVLLAATALSLLHVAAPLTGIARLALAYSRPALFAALASLGILLLSELAISMWHNMAWATLEVTAAILRLYEADVVVDTVERGIRVGGFGVAIWDECSGFEGIALVTGFVTIYLWAFRSELRFPHALALYPIGLAASWLLNSVRIATLTSIGAHFSPEMAVKGFHSQAGWVAFLLVTLGLMAIATRTGLLTRSAPASAPAVVVSPRYEATFAHLLPFVGLMAGTAAMSLAVPFDKPVYLLKVLLVASALWLCRKSYTSWLPQASGAALGAGLLVGAAWIVTAPPTQSDDPLGIWLAELTPLAATLWLLARGLGTVVLVPVAEELAFRSYLYRRIISRDFHLVPGTTISWLAIAVSSVAFGILHDRWMAGALAGVVFSLVMLRRGRLGDAITAHAVANALIFTWALTTRDWSLL